MSGSSDLLDACSELLSDFSGETVSFREFVTGRNYMACNDAWEWWLRTLEEDSPTISTTVLTGSLGGGKTYGANLLVCYRLYLLVSMGDFRAKFKIAADTPIYILYFSVSLKMAERTGFAQLRNMIDASPWFRRFCPRDKKITSSIRFPSIDLSIDFASNPQHQIGLTIFGFVLDEANFRSGVGSGMVEEYEEVQQLAAQLDGRIRSRFTRGGLVLGFSIYVSSAAFSSSFIEDKILDVSGSKYARVVRVVEYKVNPQNHSSRKFRVFVGFGQVSPCILTNKAHEKTVLSSLSLPMSEARKLVEEVPYDLIDYFKKNLYLAIQNFCGRSTSIRGSFISNYGVVYDSYAFEAQTPFLQNSLVVSDADDTKISDIIDWGKFKDPTKPHALYLDLGLSGDSGSLTCVRFDGVSVNSSGSAVKSHVHVFTLELVPPPPPAMVRISKIEDFVYEFADHVNLTVFGSDNFQSVMIRQNISATLGLPDIRISLDSTDVPHLLWLSALVDKRFRMLYVEKLDREIKEAVHDVKRHKVVKRSGSTDDLFQGLVGAFFLSDTVSADAATLDGLSSSSRLNIVGANAALRMVSSNYDLGFGRKEALESRLAQRRANYTGGSVHGLGVSVRAGNSIRSILDNLDDSILSCGEDRNSPFPG